MPTHTRFDQIDFHDLHALMPERYEDGSRYAQLLLPNGYMVTVFQQFEIDDNGLSDTCEKGNESNPHGTFELMLFQPDEEGQMRVANRLLRELMNEKLPDHASSAVHQYPEEIERFLETVADLPEHRNNKDVETLFAANKTSYQMTSGHDYPAKDTYQKTATP